MTLSEAIQPYLEKKYPLVGLQPNPADHSCDNGLLFTSIYFVMVAAKFIPYWTGDFIRIIQFCEKEPGLLVRYPGTEEIDEQDDMIGVCAFSFFYAPTIAQRICRYAENHDWVFGTNDLGRFIGFSPFVKYCAGVSLSPISEFMMAMAFVWDAWGSKTDESGKILLWLQAKCFAAGKKYFVIDLAIAVWKWRMKKLYGSPKEMFRIYYGAEHPFAQFAPEEF